MGPKKEELQPTLRTASTQSEARVSRICFRLLNNWPEPISPHPNPADMGHSYKGYDGYDSNAWIFEWIGITGQTPVVFP